MSQHFAGRAIGLCLAVIANTAANAQTASEKVVVVELYTSQGCSSCPPADEYLAQLATSPGILPLALHVDYWDYIGWADSFAQPKFTARQHAYARAAGDRMVYTPQIIVAGAERIEGNSPGKVNAVISVHRSTGQPFNLRVIKTQGTITITADASKGFDAPLMVQLVRYHPSQTVSIERGENAGRSIMYRNVVTDWTTVGEWSGRAALNMQATVSGNAPLAVIVQEPGPGKILAAARIE